MSKILIIEDDPILLESLAEFLQEEGMEVIEAENGKQGVELASRELPDLILCDIFMPKMNGYETFEKLKSDVNTSLIPFIFLTAKAEREDILYGMTLGADDYITKPIDFDELLARITKRMEKTRETIRRSEIKYHAVFETAHDAILLIRLSDFAIADANQAAVDLLGHTREEILQTSGRRFIQSIDLKETLSKHDLKTMEVKEFHDIETSWERDDTTIIQIRVSGKFVTLFGEQYLFMVARDVTEKKTYEQQLILAKEKAEESDRLKTSILSNISHELRTPLNGILGFSELLQEDLKETEYLPMIENIYLSGRRLMSTLNAIITLSQLQAGKVTMVFKHLDLVSVIETSCKQFEDHLEEKKLTLRREIPEEFVVYTDLPLFKQLFYQLVDNAIKFTREGGITIRAKTVMKDNIPWQTIEIEDTGVGIEPKFFDMIFQEFRQASEGYDRKFQGSGLGLTISRRICDLMSGKLSVDSIPGKGSTFTIWLPSLKTEKQIVPDTAETDRSHEPASTENVRETPLLLLVEDNMINRNLIELFLKPGYLMEHAYDGKTAVKMATEKKYDAVLMDINLGSGIDGIEATKKIKKIPGYKETPVIAVTGYTMLGDREKLLAEGCTHYIAKPFEKAAFRAIVKEAIFGIKHGD
ncbi:MAG: response regulator [Bacteroidales bacterium]|nr:response regulator [Bacteroidales bacterium]